MKNFSVFSFTVPFMVWLPLDVLLQCFFSILFYAIAAGGSLHDMITFMVLKFCELCIALRD